tara:strand:+ start:11133 stop:12092 length:960 start_codon:yes stop_codon:yes gene_type:complete
MKKFYKAAVIGLGRIGSSYHSGKITRTHVEAYLKNNKITNVVGVDLDYRARKNFLKRWGKKMEVFSNVKDMLNKIQPDIVSICVPSNSILDVVKEFSNKLPKLFFLEKPVLVNYNLSKKLIEAINKTPTAVNYHRSWDPSHNIFFNHIHKNKKVISIRVLYNKGMFNYSSHAIALLIKNFGKVIKVKTIDFQSHNKKKNDPSYSFILDFKNGIKALFQGFDEVSYDLFELEILTNKGLFSIKSAGCRKRVELPKKNFFYKDYNQLTDVSYPIKDGQIEGLDQAIQNITNFLDGKDKNLLCDLTTSLEVSKVISEVSKNQ